MKTLLAVTALCFASMNAHATCDLPAQLDLSGVYDASQFAIGPDGTRIPTFGSATVELTRLSTQEYSGEVSNTGESFRLPEGQFTMKFQENTSPIRFCQVELTSASKMEVYQLRQTADGVELSRFDPMGGGDLGTGGTAGISLRR